MTTYPFIYLFARHWDDEELCRLEMRAFFGKDSKTNVLMSPIEVAPSRSTFIKGRFEILFDAIDWERLKEKAALLDLNGQTFKVQSLNNTLLNTTAKIEIDERQKLEREIGLKIDSEPDLNTPDVLFSFVIIDGHWYFGKYTDLKSTRLNSSHLQ